MTSASLGFGLGDDHILGKGAETWERKAKRRRKVHGELGLYIDPFLRFAFGSYHFDATDGL
jgi:hypothetical protein